MTRPRGRMPISAYWFLSEFHYLRIQKNVCKNAQKAQYKSHVNAESTNYEYIHYVLA